MLGILQFDLNIHISGLAIKRRHLDVFVALRDAVTGLAAIQRRRQGDTMDRTIRLKSNLDIEVTARFVLTLDDTGAALR